MVVGSGHERPRREAEGATKGQPRALILVALRKQMFKLRQLERVRQEI